MKEDTINVYKTHVGAWADEVVEKRTRLVLSKTVMMLKRRGFKVNIDPNTAKHYPSIAKGFWQGIRGDLEFHIEGSGRYVGIEFFNVGERYRGYNKLGDMPKIRQLETITHCVHIVQLWEALGFKLGKKNGFGWVRLEPTIQAIRDRIEEREELTPLEHFNESWGSDRFERDETGWPSKNELQCWPRRDDLRPEMTAYCFHKGRLIRGIACPNMNGMWWLETGIGRIWPNHPRHEIMISADIPARPTRSFSGQFERLQLELSKSVEAQDFRRVVELGNVLNRNTNQSENSINSPV